MKVLSLLKSIQSQSISMIDHEHYGLNNIAKISDSARDACNFQTLLIIQTAGEEMQSDSLFGTWRMENGEEAFSTYGLTLNCFELGAGSYSFKATFDSAVVEAWKVKGLLDQMTHVMTQLSSATRATTLQEIQDLTTHERSQLTEWHAAVSKDGNLHWIVDKDDENQLKPIGASGMLLIEGAPAGSGHLGDLKIGDVTITNTPTWRPSFDTPVSTFFRTGRLAAYNPDGSISLLEDSTTDIRESQPSAAVSREIEADGSQRPKTEKEVELSMLWAETLGTDPDTIGLDDSFFQVGGDSISAMKLSAIARERGWVLPTREIMLKKTIALLAPCFTPINSPQDPNAQNKSSARSGAVDAEMSRADAVALINSTANSLDVSRPEDILEVFSCSPMQEHMLSHQSNNPLCYWTAILFNVTPDDGDAPIDGQKLRHSWRKVVRRHATLRSALVAKPDGSHFHAVLESPVISTTLFSRTRQGQGPTSIQEFRQGYDLSALQSMGLQHHLSITELGDGSVIGCLEMSHALYDGFSRHFLWDDLISIYNGQSRLSIAPSFKDYVSYVLEQPQAPARSFWGRHLTNVQPCLIPREHNAAERGAPMKPVQVPIIPLSPLKEFSTKHGLTVATVVRAAWALVLRASVGTATPCFGNLTAGRDVPVNGIAQVVGPTINIVPALVAVDGDESVVSMLTRLQESFVGCLDHQNMSLTQLYELCEVDHESGLFNYTLSYQRGQLNVPQKKNGLCIQESDAIDLTEVSDATLSLIFTTMFY